MGGLLSLRCAICKDVKFRAVHMETHRFRNLSKFFIHWRVHTVGNRQGDNAFLDVRYFPMSLDRLFQPFNE